MNKKSFADLNNRTWRKLVEERGFLEADRQKIELSFAFAQRRFQLALSDFGEVWNKEGAKAMQHIKKYVGLLGDSNNNGQ